MNHQYDIALDENQEDLQVERTEMHGGGGIDIDTFGTFGSAGTLGGTAGSLGTAGCCC